MTQRQPSTDSPYGYDWPHTLVERFHWNTGCELRHDYPWCLYIGAARSTHLPGGNATAGRTEKAVKQEKSNNMRGAISSVPEISHPLYRELATVRTRLTAVERNMPEDQPRHFFPLFPPLYILSNIACAFALFVDAHGFASVQGRKAWRCIKASESEL